ncbi:maltokinase N-terminal cap-like domain-containing protein [Nocardia jejuensis]|uniref:maltokinase N-terminal cap-like domain-containing protein n=1 Tax=Nocardia jejuensis TaxID=328049 RepID=UPI00082CB1A1|nr:hypothetical protein [Nocardia jejuensis]
MAEIHRTTLQPSKLELLSGWLPRQPWFHGAGTPRLSKAGGFRLDDPAGDVGLEFMVLTDSSGPTAITYHVPMAYRGEPLAGNDHALIGISEHGVLGRRWFYDGEFDPVLRTQALALLTGRALPQAQNESGTVDDTVEVSSADADLRIMLRINRTPAMITAGDHDVAGRVAARWRDPAGASHRGILLEALAPTSALGSSLGG